MSNTTLSHNYKVYKSELINNMIDCNFSVPELRLFSIYLSRINPRDISTRIVTFTLSELRDILGLSHLWKSELKRTFCHIMSPMEFENNNGESSYFPLFQCIDIKKGAGTEKIIEINVHDRAIPHLFHLRSHFYAYKLYNILQLTSRNQIRLYELLKQYEKNGTREIEIEQLKLLLGISPDKYSDIDNFKRKVIDVCAAALKAHTDIKFTYTTGRRSKSNKTESIIFYIEKNTPENKLETLLQRDIDITSIIEQTAARDDLNAPSCSPAPSEGERILHGFGADSNTDTEPRAAAAPSVFCSPASDDLHPESRPSCSPAPIGSELEQAGARSAHPSSAFNCTASEQTEAGAQQPHYNSDIETIIDLYPEFTKQDIQAIYNRILKLQPDKGIYNTARVDYFKEVYDDIKAKGNIIHNPLAYMRKMLDNRIADSRPGMI